ARSRAAGADRPILPTAVIPPAIAAPPLRELPAGHHPAPDADHPARLRTIAVLKSAGVRGLTVRTIADLLAATARTSPTRPSTAGWPKSLRPAERRAPLTDAGSGANSAGYCRVLHIGTSSDSGAVLRATRQKWFRTIRSGGRMRQRTGKILTRGWIIGTTGLACAAALATGGVLPAQASTHQLAASGAPTAISHQAAN